MCRNPDVTIRHGSLDRVRGPKSAPQRMSCSLLGVINARESASTMNTNTTTLIAISTAVALCQSGVAETERLDGAPPDKDCDPTGVDVCTCAFRQLSH